METKKRPTFPNLRVLAVEDNEFNLEIISDMLELFGIHCAKAINGQEAVKRVSENTYDLVFMDIRMPILDGYEASKAIRALSLEKQPLIIALTASSALREQEKFQEYGINDYLIKPVEISEIEKVLLKHFVP